MKIGIIGAMEEEVTLLRDKIDNRQTITIGGSEIYTGQLQGVDVALLKSGIGKVAAAMGATLLMEHCKPDVIINTGSAGGLASTLKVGDIVVSDETRYHDADVTAFGYEYGQLPGCPAGFKADDKLIAAAETCIKALNLNQTVQDILLTLTDQLHLLKLSPTGDKFIYLAVNSRDTNLAQARQIVKMYSGSLN